MTVTRAVPEAPDMPRHVAEAQYDKVSGSYRWVCSCGRSSRPVFPRHAADAEGQSHAARANRAAEFAAMTALVEMFAAEWPDPETSHPHLVAHQDPQDGTVTFLIRGFHEHLAYILAAVRTHQRDDKRLRSAAEAVAWARNSGDGSVQTSEVDELLDAAADYLPAR